MRNIILILVAMFLSACSTIQVSNKKCAAPNKLRARITYYNAHEDKWGAKVSMSTKLRACEGITVAAHPSFSFGTQISIPNFKGVLGDGIFTVQDRGTDVTCKKASGGKEFVFDVFLSGNKRRLKSFEKSMPENMEVIILNKG